MAESLDIMDAKETQLSILVPYLESVAKGNETSLPITKRTLVIIVRLATGWTGLYKYGANEEKPTLTPEGAFQYYLKLKEGWYDGK